MMPPHTWNPSQGAAAVVHGHCHLRRGDGQAHAHPLPQGARGLLHRRRGQPRQRYGRKLGVRLFGEASTDGNAVLTFLRAKGLPAAAGRGRHHQLVGRPGERRHSGAWQTFFRRWRHLRQLCRTASRRASGCPSASRSRAPSSSTSACRRSCACRDVTPARPVRSGRSNRSNRAPCAWRPLRSPLTRSALLARSVRAGGHADQRKHHRQDHRGPLHVPHKIRDHKAAERPGDARHHGHRLPGGRQLQVVWHRRRQRPDRDERQGAGGGLTNADTAATRPGSSRRRCRTAWPSPTTPRASTARCSPSRRPTTTPSTPRATRSSRSPSACSRGRCRAPTRRPSRTSPAAATASTSTRTATASTAALWRGRPRAGEHGVHLPGQRQQRALLSRPAPRLQPVGAELLRAGSGAGPLWPGRAARRCAVEARRERVAHVGAGNAMVGLEVAAHSQMIMQKAGGI